MPTRARARAARRADPRGTNRDVPLRHLRRDRRDAFCDPRPWLHHTTPRPKRLLDLETPMFAWHSETAFCGKLRVVDGAHRLWTENGCEGTTTGFVFTRPVAMARRARPRSRSSPRARARSRRPGGSASATTPRSRQISPRSKPRSALSATNSRLGLGFGAASAPWRGGTVAPSRHPMPSTNGVSNRVCAADHLALGLLSVEAWTASTLARHASSRSASSP
jgi:hypothetical protein